VRHSRSTTPDNAQAEFTNGLRARGFELSTVSIDVGFAEAFAFLS
jgi:hypothetical protein